MDAHILRRSAAILLLSFLLVSNAVFFSDAKRYSHPLPASSPSVAVNSNSVLVALLDSHYTELAELVEKALLLQTLEEAVGKHNITIFAPKNEALERDLDPEFKRFLLEPGNRKSLQNLLLFHVLPHRIVAGEWPDQEDEKKTLSAEALRLFSVQGVMKVDLAGVVHPDAVVRPDGVIHGIERLLVPQSVQDAFNRRRDLSEIEAVLPEGAPEVDPKTNKKKKKEKVSPGHAPPPPYTPERSIYTAMAPGPSLAPAPAPGPGSGKHWFDGESQVKDFIHTLLHYGGYSELADILVNLTSLATEMGRLVSQGYVITVLAPNDDAMAKLTTDQLSEPGAPEQIIYYHLVPEYQTEESMYNAVRRFGKIRYDTLRLPLKVTAQEADGSVKFGDGEDGNSAYLVDADIYVDGRISVQGIDSVIFPAEIKSSLEASKMSKKAAMATTTASSKTKSRRGKLLELTCSMLGVVGQTSRFSACQL